GGGGGDENVAGGPRREGGDGVWQGPPFRVHRQGGAGREGPRLPGHGTGRDDADQRRLYVLARGLGRPRTRVRAGDCEHRPGRGRRVTQLVDSTALTPTGPKWGRRTNVVHRPCATVLSPDSPPARSQLVCPPGRNAGIAVLPGLRPVRYYFMAGPPVPSFANLAAIGPGRSSVVQVRDMTQPGASQTLEGRAADPAPLPSPGDRLTRAFTEMRDELVSTLLYLLGNRDDAQDAAQEAFIKCWRARDTLPRVLNLPAWSFRVALN